MSFFIKSKISGLFRSRPKTELSLDPFSLNFAAERLFRVDGLDRLPLGSFVEKSINDCSSSWVIKRIFFEGVLGGFGFWGFCGNE